MKTANVAPSKPITLNFPALDALMESKGITKIELARQLKMSPGSIGDWFHGRRAPSRENAHRIATLLGVDVVVIALPDGLADPATPTIQEFVKAEVARAINEANAAPVD